MKNKLSDPLAVQKPNSRFDMRFQNNIEEIDNRMGTLQGQSKMEFARNKFRKDMNKIT